MFSKVASLFSLSSVVILAAACGAAPSAEQSAESASAVSATCAGIPFSVTVITTSSSGTGSGSSGSGSGGGGGKVNTHIQVEPTSLEGGRIAPDTTTTTCVNVAGPPVPGPYDNTPIEACNLATLVQPPAELSGCTAGLQWQNVGAFHWVSVWACPVGTPVPPMANDNIDYEPMSSPDNACFGPSTNPNYSFIAAYDWLNPPIGHHAVCGGIPCN